MAIISFMAGGILAFLTATSAWLFGDADVMTALKIYMIVGLVVPAVILSVVLLRCTMHDAPLTSRAQV